MAMYEARGVFEWDRTAEVLRALGVKKSPSEINPFRTSRSHRNRVMITASELGKKLAKPERRR